MVRQDFSSDHFWCTLVLIALPSLVKTYKRWSNGRNVISSYTKGLLQKLLRSRNKLTAGMDVRRGQQWEIAGRLIETSALLQHPQALLPHLSGWMDNAQVKQMLQTDKYAMWNIIFHFPSQWLSGFSKRSNTVHLNINFSFQVSFVYSQTNY